MDHPSSACDQISGSLADDVVKGLRSMSLEASPTDENYAWKIKKIEAVNNLRWHPNGKIFFTREVKNVSLSLYHRQDSYWEARLVNPRSCHPSTALPIRRPGTWDKETRRIFYKSTVSVLSRDPT